MVQEDNQDEDAFVYVWAPQYRNMLEEVPWDFDNFMKNDFEAYWKEELQEESFNA
jgi:hypothetical protein